MVRKGNYQKNDCAAQSNSCLNAKKILFRLSPKYEVEGCIIYQSVNIYDVCI